MSWVKEIPTSQLVFFKELSERETFPVMREDQRRRDLLRREGELELRARQRARATWGRPEYPPRAPWWPLDDDERKDWEPVESTALTSMSYRYQVSIELFLVADGQHDDGLGAKAQADRAAALLSKEPLILEARAGHPRYLGSNPRRKAAGP